MSRVIAGMSPPPPMSSLAILCPSRERPDLCRRMVDSALAHSQADVLLYVDLDDPQLADYSPPWPERVHLVVGEPIGRGRAVNKLTEIYRDYRAYLIVSDDITFVRDDWEAQVAKALDAYGDEIGLVDLECEHNEPQANWVVVTRTWIDTLGWLNYPGCNWFCQDTIIQVLGEALGRRVRVGPKVLHHDHLIHTDNRERAEQDLYQFLFFMAVNFAPALAKLRAVMHG